MRLAQRIEEAGRTAIIINADSAQVYGDLQILSARPAPAEMGGIEHRLYGTWDGAQACSAADWAAAAKQEIAAIHAQGAVPILCGGTGLYMQVLLEGIAPVPAIDAAIRSQVRAMDIEILRENLLSDDPQAALRINERDLTRMQRALEVVRSTGRTLSEWQECKVGGIAEQVQLFPVVLLPEREDLYERCDRRFGWMIEHGAIGEVEALLARDIDPDLPVMRAIGVPQIKQYLKQEDIDLEKLQRLGAQATRNYAKRQYTWFRNQPPKDWPRIHDVDTGLAAFRTLLTPIGAVA